MVQNKDYLILSIFVLDGNQVQTEEKGVVYRSVRDYHNIDKRGVDIADDVERAQAELADPNEMLMTVINCINLMSALLEMTATIKMAGE